MDGYPWLDARKLYAVTSADSFRTAGKARAVRSTADAAVSHVKAVADTASVLVIISAKCSSYDLGISYINS